MRMRYEHMAKITQNVAKSSKFQSFDMKLTPLTKTVISNFGPEVEILSEMVIVNDNYYNNDEGANLSSNHVFYPVAIKTLGVLAVEAHEFITKIGRRASQCTADPRETTFLYQRISTAIQRFNTVCLFNF